MIKVKFEGMETLMAHVSGMGKQVTFAAAKAITKTAKAVEARIQRDMGGAFKSASPYYTRSTFSTSASKSKLEATIGLKDKKPARGTAPSVLFKEHFIGGLRGNKPMEKAIIAMRLMPAGYRVVPGRGMEVDSFGNPKRSRVGQILQALKDGGGDGRATGKGRTAIQYFAVPVGSNHWRSRHLDPGIYRRITTYGAYKNAAIPLLLFVKQASYKKIMDMVKSAQQVVDKEFQKEFDAAFTEAMRTAR